MLITFMKVQGDPHHGGKNQVSHALLE